MTEAELIEQFLQFLMAVVVGHASFELHDGINVVLHAHLAEHRCLLGQIADANLRSFVHRQVGDVLFVEKHLARIGLDETDHHIERRGLARAVGAEQTHDLALFDFNVDIVDDRTLAVFLH